MARKSTKTASTAASELETLARAALLELTPADTVGPFVETRPGAEPGLTDVVFETAQRGYVGWSWVVTIATVDDAMTGEPQPPTIVELDLLPGEDALLAPEWVPWSVRLAEWESQQALLAAEAAERRGDEDSEDDSDDEAEDTDDGLDDEELDDSDDGDDDLDDEFDPDAESDDDDDPDADDEDDFDEDGPRSTHGGDIDGVDIDDLDAERGVEDLDAERDVEDLDAERDVDDLDAERDVDED